MIDENIKLNKIEDLNKYNLIIINNQKPIKNNLKKILQEKGLSQSDLAELTGICRQNISEITNEEMIPGVILATQISTVLDKRIEDIFTLTEDAWIKIAKNKNDTTIYLDLFNLETLNNKVRKQRIAKTGLEYIDIKQKKCISKNEYDNKFNLYITNKMGLTDRIKWIDKKVILKEFESYYINRYVKLGERITPIIIK